MFYVTVVEDDLFSMRRRKKKKNKVPTTTSIIMHIGGNLRSLEISRDLKWECGNCVEFRVD